MAMDIGTITLYREKTLFFDGAHPGPDLEPYAKLAILSNRITCLLTCGKVSVPLVVRGHNIPSALRFAGLILDALRPLSPEQISNNNLDWGLLADSAFSDYDRTYTPQEWLSIHANGQRLFASTEIKSAIDILEQEANCKEISETMLKRLAPQLSNTRQSRIRHDSRAAVVMNDNSDGVRCAVIERRRGKDAAFSFHVLNPQRKRIRLSVVLFMAADLFEMQNLYAMAERVEKVLSGALPKSAMPISLDQVEALHTRNLQLTSLVKAFHDSHTVRYRPAPPAYLPVIAHG